MRTISKVKLKKKLEEVNKVCNMDFKLEESYWGGYRAPSENSDVSSPFLDLEGLCHWLDAFMQGWIIRLEMTAFENAYNKLAKEMHQEEVRKGKGLKKRGN